MMEASVAWMNRLIAVMACRKAPEFRLFQMRYTNNPLTGRLLFITIAPGIKTALKIGNTKTEPLPCR
jgi:hypothetical protein